jgi:N-acetylmuramoyl-L-alanine amidase
LKKPALISKILITLLLAGNFVWITPAAAENYYTVRTGDTIIAISKNHGLKFNSVMTANKLNGTIIYPGQKLLLPPVSTTDTYYVRPGDNLFRIARSYGLSVKEIMTVNSLDTTLIHVGDRLFIPERKGRVVKLSSGNDPENTRPALSEGIKRYTEEEVVLLAKLIHAEARGESHLGKVAVGAVIMNRIASGKFPDNIREVIYQKTKGVYQFTPVKDGNINREPAAEAFRAAADALKGKDPTNGALFFYNPDKSSDRWIRTLPVTTRIGNHVFAK